MSDPPTAIVSGVCVHGIRWFQSLDLAPGEIPDWEALDRYKDFVWPPACAEHDRLSDMPMGHNYQRPDVCVCAECMQ